MRLIVTEKQEDGTRAGFAVELPNEFNAYGPDFLKDHFSHYFMSAMGDLITPRYIPVAIRLNEAWWRSKTGFFEKLDTSAIKESLGKVRIEVKITFIEPEDGNKNSL